MRNSLIVLTVLAGLLAGGTKPTTTKTTTKDADISEAQDIFQKLTQEGPPVTPLTTPGKIKKKVSLPNAKTVPSKSSRLFLSQHKSQMRQKLLPEGYYIANRRGRLLQGDVFWVFTFESDGKNLSDPPIKVLPNRWLEKMESDVRTSPDPIIFRISGEVTCYRGQNFLLLRKVLVEREFGAPIK